MQSETKIKAVMFDLGNTLLHFEGNWSKTMQAADRELLLALNQAGFRLDSDKFLLLFRQRLNEYFELREIDLVEKTSASILSEVLNELGYASVSETILETALRSLYLVSQEHWIPEHDSIPALDSLQNSGYRMALVSNASNDADVQALVDKAGYRPYFDFVLSSAACGIRKPDPRIFEIALSNWEFKPNQVVMVGDTLQADILGANQAGLYSIWLTRRVEISDTTKLQENISPSVTIDSLEKIPNLLNTI